MLTKHLTPQDHPNKMKRDDQDEARFHQSP
jgi:hypothetical protein